MDLIIQNQDKILALLNELKEVYRQLLYENDKVVQGNPNRLVDNINSLIKIEGNRLELGFNLPAEWKFVENGSSPHWPPVSAITDWIDQKPVTPYPDSNGRIPTKDQLAFLIGRKIATEGIEAKHLLEEAITRTDFYNRMIFLIKEEMVSHYNKEIKKILLTL